MRWWLNKNGENTGEIFDDGVVGVGPGEDGFTRDGIDAKIAELNAGGGDVWTADYMGVTDSYM